MRKVPVWVLSLVVVLAVAGMAMAAAAPAAAPAAASSNAKGSVSAVDASGMSFSVKGKGGEWTFKLADKATLKAGYKTIAFGDLKVGDWVSVDYTTSGSDKQATAVTVLGAAKPKAAK
jgi:hypothetical protein